VPSSWTSCADHEGIASKRTRTSAVLRVSRRVGNGRDERVSRPTKRAWLIVTLVGREAREAILRMIAGWPTGPGVRAAGPGRRDRRAAGAPLRMTSTTGRIPAKNVSRSLPRGGEGPATEAMKRLVQ
jgi:hypothetical protein